MRALFILGLLALSGCAAQRMEAPTSAAPASQDPRAELQDLSRRIEERRQALGPQPQMEAAPPGAGALPPAPPPAAPAQPTKAGHCDGVCRAAEDICRMSARICRLADQIADADSAHSCQQARTDCGTATQRCRSCNP